MKISEKYLTTSANNFYVVLLHLLFHMEWLAKKHFSCCFSVLVLLLETQLRHHFYAILNLDLASFHSFDRKDIRLRLLKFGTLLSYLSYPSVLCSLFTNQKIYLCPLKLPLKGSFVEDNLLVETKNLCLWTRLL